MSFHLSKCFQHIIKSNIFYTVPRVYSLHLKHKTTHLLMHEDLSIIYKATTKKKTTANVVSTPSIRLCLTLDPELIILTALKVHVRGPWQWPYCKIIKWRWGLMNHDRRPISSDESFSKLVTYLPHTDVF